MLRRSQLFIVLLAAISLIIIMFSWSFVRSRSASDDPGPEKDIPAPRLAIVLDDFGYTKENFKTLENIGIPLTFAVLPDAPYTEDACIVAAGSGMEVILHMPMEPLGTGVPLEENTIMADMTPEDIHKCLDGALTSFSGIQGISNHMGSKATGDTRVMNEVFLELNGRDMFFFDSMTTSDSICADTAKKTGIPYVKRDVFIDNVMEREVIIKQIGKAVAKARTDGVAVAIGHDRKLTVDTLAELAPRIQDAGIKFVTLSDIVEDPDNAGPDREENPA